MQMTSNRYSASESAEEIIGKFSEDFGAKLKVNVNNEKQNEELLNDKPQNQEEEEEEVVVDDDDDDFSFVCTNPDGSPICADDIFQNGKIRPIFPLFNRDLLLPDDYCDGGGDDSSSKPKTNNKNKSSLRPPLKKLFFEEGDSTSATEPEEDPTGPYCEWSGKTVQDGSPECCKKSNSTGFSKLWRFRELVQRSNSDGKDAFVFLNPSSTNNNNNNHNEKSEKTEKKNEKVKVGGAKVKAKKKTASLSAYMKSRAKEGGDKRKPYLPYKQVGFFTNVNGLSRNVHPF